VRTTDIIKSMAVGLVGNQSNKIHTALLNIAIHLEKLASTR